MTLRGLAPAVSAPAAAAAVAALLLAGALEAEACAGCRNPNIPITKPEAVHLGPGELRAGLSLAGMDMRVSHPAGCADLGDCSEVPVQPLHHHNQDLLAGEARVTAEVGLTRIFGLELQLPLKLVRTTVDYTKPGGDDYTPIDEGVHHRHETLAGLGDAYLLARASQLIRGFSLSLRAGTTLPLGRTEPDPFELGDRGEKHQHIQFGSGVFEPLLLLDISKPLRSWLLSAAFQGQAAFYENSHGFKPGNKFSGGLQVGRKISGGLSAAAGAEVMHEEPERWSGVIRQDGNLGRTEALAGLTGIYSVRNRHLGLSLRLPFYRHIESGDEPPGTLSSPLIVGVFALQTFSLR